MNPEGRGVPGAASSRIHRVQGIVCVIVSDIRVVGIVLHGNAAYSNGCESRLGNREARAQYRALRRGW